MPTYRAPVQDSLFVLNEVLHFQRYNNLPGFAEATPDMIEAILGEAGKLAEEVLQPLNQVGDHEGCTRHDDGSVTTPTGFKEAYATYREGGWGSLPFPEQYGGQNLPATLNTLVSEYVSSANMAFGMYPGLTSGAIAALIEHASDEQKETYLPKMISGEWSGTMNLTESHCGTDLGLMRSKAVRKDDGSFQISGQKIFISAVSMTSLQTSSIWFWPASKARRTALMVFHYSSYQNLFWMMMAIQASATVLRAAPSKKKWASTATQPVC